MKTIGKLLLAFIGIGLVIFVVQGCSTTRESKLPPETVKALKPSGKARTKTYGIINVVKAANPTSTPAVVAARAARRATSASPVSSKTINEGSQQENTDFWFYFDSDINGPTLVSVPVAAFPANVNLSGSYPAIEVGDVLNSDYLKAGSGYFTGQGAVNIVAASNVNGRGQIQVNVKPEFRQEFPNYKGILFVIATKAGNSDEFEHLGMYYLRVLPQ